MVLNPLRARRQRLEREREVYRTVRRVATEDVRELRRVDRDRPVMRALIDALEAATTTEQVLAIEPLATAARQALNAPIAATRTVLIGERLVPWVKLGSYAAVVEEARNVDVPHRRRLRPWLLDDARDRDETWGLYGGGGPSE